MERKRKFDEELIMTVDEVLEESFGAAGPLIYTYLESRSVKREDIPERLEEFADCIKNFSAGGSIVEAMILRKLYSKFGLEFKQTSDHNSFADQIAKLRNSFHH
ncbi:hypothetical protein GWO13_01680 [Candidatus Bathyarchaeota archaeon]|nr:hypothetical protein [Candidatus Bathyarchaeota archaeon]